jgi:3-hydroxy-9,10-secoandrosta-1,3,5(10)-triene-9,17-dione monooxygenase
VTATETSRDRNSGPAIDAATYLGRIRALLPGIRGRASETEALGRVPDQTIAELIDAGVLAGLQPRRWNGLQLDPATFFEGVVLLGSACPSTGWVASVLGVHPWELASMHPDAQADVWGDDQTTLVSSSYAPTGSATADGDDYHLSGWWGFSSGVDHAGWALLGAVVDGQEDVGPRVFLISADDFEIDHGSWDVTGLAGTGSKAIRVPGAHVPAHRTHTMAEMNDPAWERPGWAVNDSPLYRFLFTDLFSWGIAGPALGAATGFAEEWVRQSRERVPAFGGPGVAERPELRLRLAEGTNRIGLLTRSMVSAWDEASAVLAGGADLDPVTRTRLHYQGARTIPDSLEAALGMFATAGGGAMFRDNPLQRFVRDLLAMRNHPVANLERFGMDAARAALA